MLNPLAPRNFAEDRVSIKPFSGLNIENLPQNPSQVMHFAAFLQQKYLMQGITLQISGMRRKQNFEISHQFFFPGLCLGEKSFWVRFLELGGNWNFFL